MRGRCPFLQTSSYLRQSWLCHVACDSCGLAVPSRIPIAGEPGLGLAVVARHSVRCGKGMHLVHAIQLRQQVVADTSQDQLEPLERERLCGDYGAKLALND